MKADVIYKYGGPEESTSEAAPEPPIDVDDV